MCFSVKSSTNIGGLGSQFLCLFLSVVASLEACLLFSLNVYFLI